MVSNSEAEILMACTGISLNLTVLYVTGEEICLRCAFVCLFFNAYRVLLCDSAKNSIHQNYTHSDRLDCCNSHIAGEAQPMEQ